MYFDRGLLSSWARIVARLNSLSKHYVFRISLVASTTNLTSSIIATVRSLLLRQLGIVVALELIPILLLLLLLRLQLLLLLLLLVTTIARHSVIHVLALECIGGWRRDLLSFEVSHAFLGWSITKTTT